jgi:hypothetical protein
VAARSTRPLAAAIALALGAAATPSALADDAASPAGDRVAFRIESTPHVGCPGPAVLEDSVLARTKKARKAATGEDAQVFHVEFRDENGAVTGHLTVERNGQTSGARSVRGSSCDDVGNALALTIALSIDPTARLAIEPSPPPQASPDAGAPCLPAPPLASPPAPSMVVAPPAVAPARMQARMGLATGLAQVLEQGLMTTAILSGELAVRSPALLSPSVRLSVNFASNALDVPGDATFTWLSGQVELCPIRARLGSRFEILPCGAAQGGWLRGRGQTAPQTLEASRAWWTAGASAHLAALVSSEAGIELSGSAEASLHEWDFVFLSPTVPVAQTASVSWTVALGVFLTFP